MSRITYQEYLTTHQNPITDISDATVEKAVADWFKYRYIGFENVDKFTDIFRRNVAINYPIYQQKLRIEPGVSQYDWLVTQYQERQIKAKGEDTTTYTGKQINGEEGDEIHTRTGGHLTSNVEGLRVQTTSPHVGQKTVNTGTTHDEDVQGKTTQTVSPHVQKVTKTDNDHSEWAGNQQLTAVLPMSESYANTEKIEPDNNNKEDKQYYQKAYQHMPALNWDNASSQAQDGHRGYNTDDNIVTESYKYGEGVKGDITTSEGDKSNPDTRKHWIDKEDPQTTETSYVYDTGVEGDIVKTEGDMSKPGTSQFTYNGELSDGTKGERDTTSFNGRKHVTTFDGRQDTAGHESTNREQSTGRNGEIAEILRRASDWISQSSAFKWYKAQLESCFAPWYDEDGGFI